VYYSVINYVLVFLRTFNEAKACRKVLADTGSIRPYLSGVFTLLELFNLTCNYIGLVFRFIEQFLPQRLALEKLVLADQSQHIRETDVDMVVVTTGILCAA